MSGILKRKFEEVEAASPCSSARESDDDVSSSESGDSVNPSASGHFTPASILKREKRMRTRSVHFEKVTVYYFSRRQGFTSVPSQGGSTLGMSSRHCGVRHYTLGEFAREQEKAHRDMLRDHLKEEKLNSIKLKLTKNGTVESDEASVLTVEDISDDDIDLDNTEVDEYFFLQPLTTKKRRALLRASGVRKIDVEEKHELRAIRVSREDCGCDCRVFCDPETCACSMADIKCQVDRMSFPCGCTKDGCSNAAGRIEFNPIRVRTHFLHTIMKLELEKSREQQQASVANGYHGENNAHSDALVQAQHSLEYSLAEAVPQSAVMHLQTANEMNEPIEAEEEDEDEEEEDEEEDEDDEEEDNEEDEEDEDDASSLCSGLSDSSTQSLAASDSEEDDDDEDKSDDFKDSMMTPATSHGDAVTLSPVLCYSDSTMLQDSHSNGNCYFSGGSANFYRLENASAVSAGADTNPAGGPYGEAPPFQDGITNGGSPVSLGVFASASEPYSDFSRLSEEQYGGRHFGLTGSASSVIVCAPDQENDVQSSGAYHEQQGGCTQIDFQNYLNNNSQEGYINNSHCFMSEKISEGSSTLNEVPSLQDNRQTPPQVTSV